MTPSKFLLLLVLALFIVSIYSDKTPTTEKKEESEMEEDEEDEQPAKVFTNVSDVLKDIKENKLKDLFVRNLKISEEEAKLIAQELTVNQNLDRFVLTKNENLTPSILKIITSSFSKNIKLRVIGFTKNKIGDEGAQVIAEGIKNHPSLSKFYLYHTDVTSKGVEKVVSSLSTLVNLIKTVIIENKIGDEGALLFSEFLKTSKLTDLILRDCDIQSKGFKALGNAMKESKTLLKVDFSENPMDLESVKGLSEGIEGNQHLTHLELAFNSIDSIGAKVLSNALLSNKVLKRVDLSENKIGNEGAKEFGSFLEKDTPLEKLDLSNNKIKIEGTKYLFEGISKNKNLKRLFFYRNEVDDSLKELYSKVGDRVKSEYSDEREFKEDESEKEDEKEKVDKVVNVKKDEL